MSIKQVILTGGKGNTKVIKDKTCLNFFCTQRFYEESASTKYMGQPLTASTLTATNLSIMHTFFYKQHAYNQQWQIFPDS